QPFRQDGPLLTVSQWDSLLRDCGFSGIEGLVHDYERAPSNSLLVSRSVLKSRVDKVDIVVIETSGSIISGADCVRACRKFEGMRANYLTWHEIQENDLEYAYFIILDNLEAPLLTCLDRTKYQALQRITHSAKSILWVAPGLYGTSPNSDLITGFSRVIAAEVPGLQFADLGIDDHSSQDLEELSSPDVVINQFRHCFLSESFMRDQDTEFVQRNGCVYVPRMVADQDIHRFISSEIEGLKPRKMPVADSGKCFQATLDEPGDLRALYFKERTFNAELREGEIQIEVQAAGLNFKDVAIAHGHIQGSGLGQECSGVVVNAGSESRLKPGDRVCAVVVGAYATQARVPWKQACQVPDSVSLSDAAGIPIIFLTAWYGLFELAKIGSDDKSILIHSAAGGLGQAAIMCAQVVGLEIYATVSTDEKADLLVARYGLERDHIFNSRTVAFGAQVMAATNNRGVDVVLNSLTGEQLRTSWDCLAPCGRFIEVGKKDINAVANLTMAPFERNLSFCAVDLGVICEHRLNLVHRMLNRIMDWFAKGKFRMSDPLVKIPLSQLGSGLRNLSTGKTMGKFIAEVRSGDEVDAITRTIEKPLAAADGTYVILGGTGGIGLSLCRFLVANGARSVLLVSRSGGSLEDTQHLIEESKEIHATVTVAKCDICNIGDVQALVSQAPSPIRGIIQATAVFKDSLFQNQSLEDFDEVLQSKVKGTWNVWNSLSQTPTGPSSLDFFIVLSSVSGVAGNRGQAAYAAANTFLDGFARMVQSKGINSASLALGVVRGIGILTDEMAEHLSRALGSYPMDEAKLWAVVKAAIKGLVGKHESGQVITGYNATDQWFTTYPRFALATHEYLESQKLRTSNLDYAGDDGTDVPISQRLRGASTHAVAVQLISEALKDKLASLLTIAKEDVVLERSLVSYGLDSLVSVELRHWLVRDLDAQISVFELLGTENLESLFTKKYASRPNHVVIATARDPKAAAKTFSAVPTASGSEIVSVALHTTSPSSAKEMISTLQSKNSIPHLDIVIANAGVSKHYATVLDSSIQEFRDHWEINTLGLVITFQAVCSLLAKANTPKFVVLSTMFATIGGMDDVPYPNAAYGSSKAAVNFVVRKIHFENEGLIAFPIHPGWVQTDQGNSGAKSFGMEHAPLTPEESVDGIVSKARILFVRLSFEADVLLQIDSATRENLGGVFESFDGKRFPW
ncbi:MAG: hypothetical protein Q9227_000790, partial [Pyrenula ochraceoflavens]